jgi:hypothetical protein
VADASARSAADGITALADGVLRRETLEEEGAPADLGEDEFGRRRAAVGKRGRQQGILIGKPWGASTTNGPGRRQVRGGLRGWSIGGIPEESPLRGLNIPAGMGTCRI